MGKFILVIASLLISLPLIADEPKWVKWPKVRTLAANPFMGSVLQDVDSHLEAGHQYSANSYVTWTHETTHGINSNIRNSVRGRKVNGFYCLKDRAIIIDEPSTQIEKVADRIPEVLRGPSFDLYLIQQRKDWNNEPLYLLDEWTAYMNGSECGKELSYSGWYYEILQAHNFNVYTMYLAMEIKENCKNYDDKIFKSYVMWNIERSFEILKNVQPLNRPVFEEDKNPAKPALDYIEKVRTDKSGEGLRKFARDYFGKEWCKKVYGF